MVGVVRGGVGLRPETNAFKAYDYTLNENGTPVQYGHDPADFKQDVLTRKAVNFVNRRAPRAQPFFLWLTYTAPHYGGPDPNPQPPSDCKYAPKPAPRHAHAFDSEPLPKPPELQRGRRLRQAGRDPEPNHAWTRIRSRTSGAGTGASWNRCCRWTRGSRSSWMRCGPEGSSTIR